MIINKTFRILSFLFCLTLLFSCEPGRDENGDLLFGLQHENPNQTKRLSKIVETGSNGVVNTINYLYDNKQLIQVIVNKNGTVNTIDIAYEDGKMSQLINTASLSTNQQIATIDLVYTGGQLTGTEESIKVGDVESFKNSTLFSYGAGGNIKKIITTKTQNSAAAPDTFVTSETLTSDLLFASNNVTSWNLKTNDVVGGTTTNVKSTFSKYDTYKNPLATLPVEFILATVHCENDFGNVKGLSTNNYKMVKTTVAGQTQTAEEEFTYEYDGANYPKSAKSAQVTIKYTYQ